MLLQFAEENLDLIEPGRADRQPVNDDAQSTEPVLLGDPGLKILRAMGGAVVQNQVDGLVPAGRGTLDQDGDELGECREGLGLGNLTENLARATLSAAKRWTNPQRL